MPERGANPARGARISQALDRSGRAKALAVAAELNVSPVAISKWRRGDAISLENACRLAQLLDVSLDWLLLGRNTPDWMREDELRDVEVDLISKLRRCPDRVGRLVSRLVSEIPESEGIEAALKPPN